MTYLAKKTALSGWVLVAVLNTGTLMAQAASDLPVAPSEQTSLEEFEGSTDKLDGELQDPAGDAGPVQSYAKADMDYMEVATKLGLGLGLVIMGLPIPLSWLFLSRS